MDIVKLTLGACDTNVYIVAAASKNAVLIDPADEAGQITAAIEEAGYRLKYVFLTHAHTDHVLALEEIRDHFGVPVVVGKEDAARLLDEDLINDRPYAQGRYRAVQPDILVSEGDEIWLDELRFSFYAMKGHTAGSLAIVVNDVIFSGDTLLYEGHGRTDLYGGDEEELVRSMKRMMRDFKDSYRVLTGHRRETTIGHEREHNPYLKQ